MFNLTKAFAHFQVALGPKAKSQWASSLFADEEFSKVGSTFRGLKIHFERLINEKNLSHNCCNC